MTDKSLSILFWLVANYFLQSFLILIKKWSSSSPALYAPLFSMTFWDAILSLLTRRYISSSGIIFFFLFPSVATTYYSCLNSSCIYESSTFSFNLDLAGRNYLFPRPIPKNTNANQMIILSLISPFVNPSLNALIGISEAIVFKIPNITSTFVNAMPFLNTVFPVI